MTKKKNKQTPQKKLSPDDYWEKAKQGIITDEEIDQIAEEILINEDVGQLSTLILALRKSGMRAQKHSDIVEHFIHLKVDMLVASSLRALDSWGLTKNYLNEIKTFMKGVEWDSGHVRIMAISIAGNYLRNNFDPDLLQILLDIFEHLGEDDSIKDCEDEESRVLIKECAYEAICWAMGKTPQDLYSEGEIDNHMIVQARLKLKNNN